MRIFIALFFKEIKILLKDKIGLLALFVMPAVLLIVITCVQNINYVKGQKTTLVSLLVVSPSNEKTQPEYQNLMLDKDAGVKVISENYPLSKKEINELLKKYNKQAALIIPENAFSSLNSYIKGLINSEKTQKPSIKLDLIYGSNIDSLLSLTQLSAVKSIIQEAKNEILLENLIKYADNSNINKSSFENIVSLNEEYVKSTQKSIPSPVQQNIPAWTIFGMFFILIPMASTLIKEKETKVISRLFTTPLNSFSFLGSKILAYFIINMIQLIFMVVIGIKILPLFGIEKFIIGNNCIQIIVIGICVSLAAIGFGLLIGVLAKSHQQASSIGPILIVIAAAIGGVMVPTYLMPENIRFIAAYSPLNWGQEAFLQVLSKNETLFFVISNLYKLLVFFIVCFFISVLAFKKGLKK